MKEIFAIADNIVTPLGFSTQENAANMLKNITGIRQWNDVQIAPEPFYASLIDDETLNQKFASFDDPARFTRFEKMIICSVKDALSNSNVDFTNKKTLFILSTTKGNIDLLEKNKMTVFGNERTSLWHTARLMKEYFSLYHMPLVVSNACISGLLAIIIGARLIRNGLFENVVINGSDIITEFVISGFNSFKSLSTGPCRPFDKTRDGLSLGEGSGTIILSSNRNRSAVPSSVCIGEGFSTNDANHISGPSRTGEGLFLAISKVLNAHAARISYISAHGTATLYNDEMESIAFTRAGLQNVPVNSFKGYWGHTLGAAGVIESAMAIYSLKNNLLLNTLGFNETGVSNPISVISKATPCKLENCLKVASGFGGCNAALLFYKA